MTDVAERFCLDQHEHPTWGLIWCELEPGHGLMHQRQLPDGLVKWPNFVSAK